MGYLKFIDDLPHVAKIILAIVVNPLFVVYRFIADIIEKKNWLILWDVLLGVVVGVVFFILNIISVIKDDKVFSFERFFPKK